MTTAPVPSITEDLLQELEQKAQAATPGEWYDDDADDSYCIASSARRAVYSRLSMSVQPWASARCDIAYIAAANPATILAMVEHIRSLTERLWKVEKDAARWRFNRAKSLGSPEAADAAIDAAIAQEGADHE